VPTYKHLEGASKAHQEEAGHEVVVIGHQPRVPRAPFAGREVPDNLPHVARLWCDVLLAAQRVGKSLSRVGVVYQQHDHGEAEQGEQVEHPT
jgi:hypothetical protein